MLTFEDLLKRSEIRIDLGSGLYPRAGFAGIDNFEGQLVQLLGRGHAAEDFDKIAEQNPVIDWDLMKGIPLPDHSVAEVHTSHFLEHFPNLDLIFQEVYRVLLPAGGFTITVPYAQSAEGLYPGHSLFFTEKWFEENPLFQKLFVITARKYDYSEYYQLLPLYSRVMLRIILPGDAMRRLLFNVVNQMTLSCVPRDPARLPSRWESLKPSRDTVERFRTSRTGQVVRRLLPARVKYAIKRRLMS